MTPMSYEYIAGFFDGEGSVGKSGRMPFVTMSQATIYADVLYRMAEFVQAEGIPCGVYHVKPRATQFKTNMKMSTLKFNSIDSMTAILTRLMPFLYVKKQRAQNILDYIAETGFQTDSARLPRLKQATIEYQSGIGVVAAAKNNDLSWKTLRDYMVKNSIHIRTPSESKVLWWQGLSEEKRAACKKPLEANRHPLFSSTNQPTG